MNQANDRRGVLVVQPLPGIGDMVWHLPHLRAIARHEPEGRVSVLTKPRSLSDQLLASLPEVAEVLWVRRKPGPHDGLPGFFRLVSELRQKRYRKVWILHDSRRYLVAAWLAGIPRRAGIAGGWQRMLLTDLPAVPVPNTLHTVERADLLLRGLAIEVDRPVPLIAPQESARVAIRARFAAFPRPWFVLGIGSSEAYKQCVVDSNSDDIVYSSLFTGVHGNYLKPSIRAAGLDPDQLPESDPSAMNFGGDAKKAWKDIWGCGQGIGAIDAVVPAAERVARLRREYEAARARLCGLGR